MTDIFLFGCIKYIILIWAIQFLLNVDNDDDKVNRIGSRSIVITLVLEIKTFIYFTIGMIKIYLTYFTVFYFAPYSIRDIQYVFFQFMLSSKNIVLGFGPKYNFPQSRVHEISMNFFE